MCRVAIIVGTKHDYQMLLYSNAPRQCDAVETGHVDVRQKRVGLRFAQCAKHSFAIADAVGDSDVITLSRSAAIRARASG